MAIKLTLNNTKGGTTKTTSAVNLAGALMKVYPSKKTLIVDTDGQGNVSTTFNLSKKEYEEADTMYEVFINDFDPKEAIINLYGNIDIIPANSDMDYLDFDFMNLRRDDDIKDIYNLIQKNKEIINLDLNSFKSEVQKVVKGDQYFNLLKGKFDELDKEYDFIIFDTPPEMKAVTASVLALVDYVIIPFEPDAYSAEGISRLYSRILSVKKDYNPNLQVAGLLPVKVDLRTKLHNSVMLGITKFAMKNNIHYFDTLIPSSVRFATATASGLPATLVDTKSTNKFTASYFDLVDELIDMKILPKKTGKG